MDTMDRFWSQVDRPGPNECWPWTGRIRRGYGEFTVTVNGKTVWLRAHRVALSGLQSVFPTLFACHHCDNPICCNPKHLYFGTVLSNNRDRVQRGRSGNNKAKGVADVARRMFADGVPKAEIARRLGVTPQAVRFAVNNQNPRTYTVKFPLSPPAPPLAPP